MSNVKSDLVIENENLFRTLFFAPVVILLVLFGETFLMSPGLVFFKAIYVLMALYASISMIAYGALYTNEVFSGEAEALIKNKNLLKALYCTPLAAFFWFIADKSIMSSGSIVFNVVYVLAALYFALSAHGYAAFYTNDYNAQDAHSA